MLRIVSSNNGEVFRHLGGAAFRRLELEHAVAADRETLLRKVEEMRPDLVLIDVQMPDASGFELSRIIKSNEDLASTRVILLLSHLISRTELEALNDSLCDDVLVLPISGEDFYHHLATVTGLPVRRTPRIGIQLTMQDADLSIAGTVVNVSTTGLGIRVAQCVEEGQKVDAAVRLEGERCDFHGSVAWCRPSDDDEPGYLAGLELEGDIPIRARLMLEQLSLFDVHQDRDEVELPGALVVALQGDFTEAVDFGQLAKRLSFEPLILFDMGGVRYISSAGVKSWCELIEALEGKTYKFRHCSVAFASQLAMVPGVLGSGQVVSLETPYHCPECLRDDLRLLETKALLREGDNITPPALRCPSCAGELEFDDVPNRYFAFLRDSNRSSIDGSKAEGES